MRDPRHRPERYGSVQAGVPEIVRVQLTATLAAGGSATAKIVTPTGAGGAYEASAAAITVYDPLNRFSGTSGDRFWAIWRSDSQKWELLAGASGEDANEPIRFQLIATLSPGGTADANEVVWDDDDEQYELTGDTITVRDFTASPGTWRGVSGYQGWCLLMEDRGDYEILWMETKAGWVYVESTTSWSGSPGDITATCDVLDYGGSRGDVMDPGATVTVLDLTDDLGGTTSGVAIQGLAFLDKTNDRYVFIPDRHVAVAAMNTPGFLKDQFQDFNAVAQFATGQDIPIEFELTGAVPGQNLKAFADSSGIAGYNAAVEQFLAHNASGSLVWQADNDTDKFVAVSAANNADYLGNLLSDRAHSGVVLGIDFTTIGVAPNQTIDAKSDLALVTGYSSGTEQFLAHTTGGVLVWQADNDTDELVAVSAANNADYLQDLLTDRAHSGVVLGVDFTTVGVAPNQTIDGKSDLALVGGYNGAAEQFLAHNASGVLVWQADNDTDELVAVSASNNPDYLGNLLDSRAHSGVQLGVDVVTVGSAPNQSIEFRSDLSTVSGYNGSVEQFLAHTASGVLVWQADNNTDTLVAVSSSNNAGYLAAQFSDKAHSGVVLGIDFTTIGSAPNQTIDAKSDLSSISGYSGSSKQALCHNAGSLFWMDIDECS